MRNITDGEKKTGNLSGGLVGWEKIITEIVTTITVASRLPVVAPTATLLLLPITFISVLKITN